MLHEILSRYLKAVESFPHHKHTQQIVLASFRPAINQVIEEALDEMSKV